MGVRLAVEGPIVAASSVTVSWSGNPQPGTTSDWIGFFNPGVNDQDATNYLPQWKYTSGLESGSVTLNVPTTPGPYVLLYCFNNQYKCDGDLPVQVVAATDPGSTTTTIAQITATSSSISPAATTSVGFVATSSTSSKLVPTTFLSPFGNPVPSITTSSSSSDGTSTSGSGPNIAAIVGGSVAGLLLVAVIAGVLVFVMTRKKKPDAAPQQPPTMVSSDSYSSPVAPMETLSTNPSDSSSTMMPQTNQYPQNTYGAQPVAQQAPVQAAPERYHQPYVLMAPAQQQYQVTPQQPYQSPQMYPPQQPYQSPPMYPPQQLYQSPQMYPPQQLYPTPVMYQPLQPVTVAAIQEPSINGSNSESVLSSAAGGYVVTGSEASIHATAPSYPPPSFDSATR